MASSSNSLALLCCEATRPYTMPSYQLRMCSAKSTRMRCPLKKLSATGLQEKRTGARTKALRCGSRSPVSSVRAWRSRKIATSCKFTPAAAWHCFTTSKKPAREYCAGVFKFSRSTVCG
eukprot:10613013-Karenia_brevis.AAC.1